MVVRREILISAIAARQIDEIGKLISEHCDKHSSFSLDEVLSELSGAQFGQLWSQLDRWCQQQYQLIGAETGNSAPSAEFVVGCRVLEAGAILATASITSVHLTSSSASSSTAADGAAAAAAAAADLSVTCHQSLLNVAVSLNALLLQLDCVTSCDALAANVALLSEQWCHHRLPRHHTLLPNLFIYLAQLYFDPTVKIARPLLRRIASLRHYLNSETDYTPPLPPAPAAAVGAAAGGESGRQLQLLAAVCSLAGCHQLVALDDGVRLVARLLRVAALRQHVHAAVLAALWSASAAAARRYGHCYYTAWKQCGASCAKDKQWLEDECLQDIMYRAVHCDRSSANVTRLWRSLFQLLHHWHVQHRHRDTAALLHRLYTPLLWRSLSAPNECAVLNAAYILFDVFPLECPGEPRELRDTQLQRQCDTMTQLLTDRHHRVRCVAAKGVCKVMSQYWDLVPLAHRKSMIQTVIQELAFDSSSLEVRIQAVQSQMILLDNPLSHVHMSCSLPALGAAFHDTDLMVRIAVCDLLLNVKSIQNIRYFDIVPAKHLLARLAIDEPPVCRRIVQLMANSFFPDNDSDETILGRCIYLVQENAEASRQFYLHSSSAIDIASAARLLLVIRQALAVHVRRHHQLQLTKKPATAAKLANGGGAGGGGGYRRGQRRPATATGANDKENPPHYARGGKRRLYNAEDRSVLTESQESGSSDDSASTEAATANTTTTTGGNGSSSSGGGGGSSVLDQLEVVQALVEAAGVLWTARMCELNQRPDLERQVIAAWTPVLPMIYNFYKDTAVAAPLMYLCSLVPHSAMAAMSSHCLSTMRHYDASGSQSTAAAGLAAAPLPQLPPSHLHCLQALVNWGRAEDVVELAGEVMHSHLAADCASFVASTRTCARNRSSVGVRFREPMAVAAGAVPLSVAAGWLLQLLRPSARRHNLLAKRGRQLAELVQWLTPHVQSMCEEAVASAGGGGGRGGGVGGGGGGGGGAATGERVTTVCSAAQCVWTVAALLCVHGDSGVRATAVETLTTALDFMTAIVNAGVQWNSVCSRVCALLSVALFDCAMIGGCTPQLARASCSWLIDQLNSANDVGWCGRVLGCVSDLVTRAVCQLTGAESSVQHEWRHLLANDLINLLTSTVARYSQLSGNSELTSRAYNSITTELAALIALWLRVPSVDNCDALACLSSAILQLLVDEVWRTRDLDVGGDESQCELSSSGVTAVFTVLLNATRKHTAFQRRLVAQLCTKLQQHLTLADDECGLLMVSALMLHQWQSQPRSSSAALSQLLTDSLAAAHSLASAGTQNDHQVALKQQVDSASRLLRQLH